MRGQWIAVDMPTTIKGKGDAPDVIVTALIGGRAHNDQVRREIEVTVTFDDLPPCCALTVGGVGVPFRLLIAVPSWGVEREYPMIAGDYYRPNERVYTSIFKPSRDSTA